jgi:hypothetical protein
MTERQSHSLSEVEEVKSEVEIPKNGGAFVVQKFSTRQEGDIPRNTKELLLGLQGNHHQGATTST